MVKQITAGLLQMEGHMHTRAIRSQFEIKERAVIHTPTGAEFIPQSGDSVLVWTGDIGQKLPSGDVYQYRNVLHMMRTVWRERCSQTGAQLEPISAA